MSDRTCSVDNCDTKHYARGLCRRHYGRMSRTGQTEHGYRPPKLTAHEAFRHYMPGDPPATDCCWEWPRGCDKRGYGVIGVGYRMVFAHRLSYEIFIGPIPLGLLTRHACDNPPCCNPAHLILGTDADNSDDKVSRGRQARGEKVANAKLTDDIVRDARRMHASGAGTVAALARRYGVHHVTMSNAIAGKRWKHVVS